MEEQLKGKCDYFTQFIKECIKDLETKKICYVYRKEQADLILNMFNNATVKENDMGFVITLPKKGSV